MKPFLVMVLLTLVAGTTVTLAAGIDTGQNVNTLPFSIQGTTYMILAAPTAGGAGTFTLYNTNVFAAGYYHNSDMRLKENIRPAPGLSAIEQLQGVSYNWKQDGTPGMGVLAQNVEQIIPGAVRVNGEGYKAVEYDQLMGPMIEAIKELKAQNDRQAAEIDELRAEIRR